ncbi:5-oxoprolinase subunit C family protein [Roseivivax sp. CAU 1761]
MSGELIVHRAGPGVTVQDAGRPGWLAYGVSRGGAADRLALAEGAALLGQAAGLAALEMAGTGGRFELTRPARIALTGAPMAARCDGAALAWNASHALPAGAVLEIGGALRGVYGYLHVGGGIATEPVLGSRAAHLNAGIGAALAAGDRLPLGDDPGGTAGRRLEVADRFSGGALRVVASLQTANFSPATRQRFETARFTRDARGNRMGVRLGFEGEGFQAEGGLAVVSEVIVPGDIQVTGDGAPYVLLSECQTTGGYPRIGTVIAPDLPRIAQAAPGAPLTCRFVALDEARALVRADLEARAGLARRTTALVRDPHDMPDLLAYQLVGGVSAGDELDSEG